MKSTEPLERSAAGPIAFIYAALIIYASLYPFSGWRDQGLWFGAFLTNPLPQYWTGFDLWSNFIGYIPLGVFLVLAQVRGFQHIQRWSARRIHPILTASLISLLLSFWMESLQLYLPARVPSNIDFLLNSLGALAGACLAWQLEAWGWLARWTRFRQHWFDRHPRGALILLSLWPWAILFPEATPFGLGQVWHRLSALIEDELEDIEPTDGFSYFFDQATWLENLSAMLPSTPLSSTARMVCAALGLLLPVLLAYSVMRRIQQRLMAGIIILALGFAVMSLSSALSYNPAHTLVWLNAPVLWGLGLGTLLGLSLCSVTRRMAVALAILALGVSLTLLNQSSVDSYQTLQLQTWEQGRFIRFSGLAQWLGWCWPYAVLIYLLTRISKRDAS
jgi:VanZ family protein